MKNETKQVKEETIQMAKAKQLICLQISENHLKVASLEFDLSTLNQVKLLVYLKFNILIDVGMLCNYQTQITFPPRETDNNLINNICYFISL